eukprot:1154694-Rhodomonas_salina.1
MPSTATTRNSYYVTVVVPGTSTGYPGQGTVSVLSLHRRLILGYPGIMMHPPGTPGYSDYSGSPARGCKSSHRGGARHWRYWQLEVRVPRAGPLTGRLRLAFAVTARSHKDSDSRVLLWVAALFTT